MASGVDGNEQRELGLLTRPPINVVGIGWHWLAGLLIEKPDMKPSIIYFDGRFAIDGDLVASALGRNILPMSTIEPAAVRKVAAMKDTMQLRLGAASVVEAIPLPNNPISESNLLRDQRVV